MNNIIKRTFWTLKSGIATGYIEEIGKTGIIFKHDFVKFRITSSNTAHGDIQFLSTQKLSTENKEQLNKMLILKKPVTIKFRKDLIGNPIKGYTGGIYEPLYLDEIL